MCEHSFMAKLFVFRCPRTGFNVEGQDSEEERALVEAVRYQMVACPACGGFHLVDPETGEHMSERR